MYGRVDVRLVAAIKVGRLSYRSVSKPQQKITNLQLVSTNLAPGSNHVSKRPDYFLHSYRALVFIRTLWKSWN